MKSAERQTWIDYARGIAIVLVLYRHVFEGIKHAGFAVHDYLAIEHANILFFSFRMPLFFVISGMFVVAGLAKRGLSSFIETKGRTILYPYFVWGILQISIQLLLKDYVNANRTPESYLYLLYSPRLLDQFWYLYALFNVTVLYAIVEATIKPAKTIQLALGAVLFAVSIYAYQQNINLYFVGDILHYYLFLAIGGAVGSFINNPAISVKLSSYSWLLMMLLPFSATQYYYLIANIPYAEMNYDFVEYYEPLRFIIIALVGTFFVILISFTLQRLNRLKWLHLLGRHSLYIYVTHVMALAATRIFMTRVLNVTNIPVLFFSGILFGLFLPIVIYKIAIKFNMGWLFSLDHPKKVQNNKVAYHPLSSKV
jgi:fucose 4-O-acetylase-like acetyltransferase